MTITILRLPKVLAARGRRKSSHYDDIHAGLFVPPVAIGARAKGYPNYEVEALNAARIAGRSDDEIRQLVRDLIAARSRNAGGAK